MMDSLFSITSLILGIEVIMILVRNCGCESVFEVMEGIFGFRGSFVFGGVFGLILGCLGLICSITSYGYPTI